LRNTIAIGNAPSSGSTLLADLLDSTPFTAAGPELNLFSSQYLYDFSNFGKNLKRSSPSSSIQAIRNRINLHRIHAYGHNEQSFLKLIDGSKNLDDFLGNFALHYLALRGKEINGVVLEKTPQNLTNLDLYFERTGNFFIHIVRDPIDVYKSLLRRKVPKNLALLAWFIDEAKIFRQIEHEKLVVIRYEDLVCDPYRLSSEIIKKVTGKLIEPEAIEQYRNSNNYRKLFTGQNIKVWRNKSFGEISKNTSHNLSDQDVKDLSSLRHLKITSQYAKANGVAEVCFLDLLKEFGYSERFEFVTAGVEANFRLSNREKVRLARKYFLNLVHGGRGCLPFPERLSPVVRV
jgi:hypothetical protein